ncbi:MAG: hypothetical protein MHM6MM_004161 [Cercozoa sp. M6MM]
MWPSHVFSSLFGGDEDVFDNMLTRMRSCLDKEMSAWPRCDVSEDDENYTLSADVPGAADDDLKVRVDTRDHALIIDGSRESEKRSEGKDKERGKWSRIERQSGSFMRRFALPKNANADERRNGVLTVRIPKLPGVEAEEAEAEEAPYRDVAVARE